MKEKYLLLKSIQDALLSRVSWDFKRSMYDTIHWQEVMIGLIGERGVGKTTIMLQRLKETGKGFYFSADSSIIKDIWLFQFLHFLSDELDIRDFYIDEIHTYPDWTREIKNTYDSIPDVRIVFSGSSSLDLFAWVLDLGRRASFYSVHTLNYREYLQLFHGLDIPDFSFEDILINHSKIALEYGNLYKEERWSDFILRGQYPYSKDLEYMSFIGRFQNLLDKIILEDIPVFLNMQTVSLDKIRKVFYFIATSTPSELSFTYLSKKIWVDKSIVENTVVLLSKIGLISLIPKFGDLSDRVRKEYKILLGNTNLYSAYNLQTDIGILRESFFVSSLKKIPHSEIFLPRAGDFVVEILDKKYFFEIGGKNKRKSDYPPHTFIIKDGIRVSDNEYTIPLWLFGIIR